MPEKSIWGSRTIGVRIAMIGIAYCYHPIYEFIQKTPECYFALDFVVTFIMRLITNEKVKLFGSGK